MQTETIQTDNVDKLQKKNHRRKVNEKKSTTILNSLNFNASKKKRKMCAYICDIFRFSMHFYHSFAVKFPNKFPISIVCIRT